MNSPWISLPADTPTQKSLRNQIGPGRSHGFLRYMQSSAFFNRICFQNQSKLFHFTAIGLIADTEYNLYNIMNIRFHSILITKVRHEYATIFSRVYQN